MCLAVKRDDVDMTKMLLTHWKKCDDDEYTTFESTRRNTDSGMMTKELSMEAQVFKTNPNARDMKGWNCIAVAVFHKSKKVIPILLDHGADPTMRSTYNKNALDLAKVKLNVYLTYRIGYLVIYAILKLICYRMSWMPP